MAQIIVVLGRIGQGGTLVTAAGTQDGRPHLGSDTVVVLPGSWIELTVTSRVTTAVPSNADSVRVGCRSRGGRENQRQETGRLPAS